jgi:SAM-dependent methyltransferase
MSETQTQLENYRQRVEADWANDEAAAAWQKHYHTLREHLSEVTRALVSRAGPMPGMNVLDLASGTGEPAIPLAKEVGPNGRVTATDLNPAMLSALQFNAAEQGVQNISFKVVDGESLPFTDESFDLVTSRFGVMFFPDTQQALGHVRRVLKPNSKAAFAVWGAPAPGTYFGDVGLPFVKRLPEPPDPDGPGPMRFAEPGKFAGEMRQAGFKEVTEEILNVPAMWPGTPENVLASFFEIATPIRNAVAEFTPEQRDEATQEVLNNLRQNFDGTHTHSIAPIIVVRGSK